MPKDHDEQTSGHCVVSAVAACPEMVTQDSMTQSHLDLFP